MSDAALKYPEYNDKFFKVEEDIISEYKKLNDKCDSIIEKIKKRKSKNEEWVWLIQKNKKQML